MSVSLIVPFRVESSERARNWKWLYRRYQREFPEWEIVVCSDGGGEWSKGRAVSLAVRQSSGDTLVIADADVYMGVNALRQAVIELQKSAWVVPHRYVYRLTEAFTLSLLLGPEDLNAPYDYVRRRNLIRSRKAGPIGGGVSVLSRAAFDAVGGIDERFLGWGGEDISFARSLDTLVGPHRRLGAPMWHLYHPPMVRREGDRASDENERLAALYLDASGDPERMREVCQRSTL
jgi:N-terminal domain of galactosyltransferase